MNPYRFENQNREIVLSRYNMPTPWMNYLSNGTLHAMISQAGGGVAWYKSPQIWRINHYRFFHLPTDRSGFYTYIKDGDSVWCPTSEPCACKPEKWEAAHGMGYTRFTAERDGLRTEVITLRWRRAAFRTSTRRPRISTAAAARSGSTSNSLSASPRRTWARTASR